MSTDQKIVPTSKRTKNRISFFGPPPLLIGEDHEAYNQLLASVIDCVAPADCLEEIWTNDIVQQTWDIIRYRRSKTAMLNNAMPNAVALLLSVPMKKTYDVERVEQLLASAGMTIDQVQGRALEFKLEQIDKVERLITLVEMRRSATFREIDRHRERKQFAKALRTKIAEIEATEAETITAAPQLPD